MRSRLFQQRLQSLGDRNATWKTLVAKSADGGRGANTPPWLAAFGVVGLAHLTLIVAALIQPVGESGPAPGTGARTFDVVMLPSWPQRGETRKASLGQNVTGVSDAHAVPRATAMANQGSRPPAVDPAPRDLRHDEALAAVDALPKPASPPVRGATAVADIAPNTPNAAAAVWEGQVIAKLASVTRYPARARFENLQDTVMVRLTLDRSGRVLAARIQQSRGYAILDSEAQALARRASPLPAPPADVIGETVELIAPINFVLRRS